MYTFFTSFCYVDIRCMCYGSCPTMHRSVFNCSKFYPWGAITLIQRVVSAKPFDWSEMHSNCADNSQKAQSALMVGGPTLLGIISEIISNISCFSAFSLSCILLWRKLFIAYDVYQLLHTHFLDGHAFVRAEDVDRAVKCVCEKFLVWTVVVTRVSLSQQAL